MINFPLCRSPAVRFQLINLRMNRYFKRSKRIVKIENYLNKCSLGDWFVLYQLSKNLNRPFFMDFLTTLSNKFAHGHLCDAEDPDDDTGPLLSQMDNFLKPSAKQSNCKKSLEEDTGDNLIEMITQRTRYDEPDGKKKEGDGSDKEEEEDDDDGSGEDDDKKDEKKGEIDY